MTAFARFLGEKAERYIELRHSLGCAFSKQAGTLRAFVRHVERSQLDVPATQTTALDFALSFGGAANGHPSLWCHGAYNKRPCGVLNRACASRGQAFDPVDIGTGRRAADVLCEVDEAAAGLALKPVFRVTVVAIEVHRGAKLQPTQARRMIPRAKA